MSFDLATRLLSPAGYCRLESPHDYDPGAMIKDMALAAAEIERPRAELSRLYKKHGYAETARVLDLNQQEGSSK